MKSIRQIFKNNLDLLDEPEVQELIEYTQELEGQVLDTKIEKQYDHQDVLLMMIRDIHKSCGDTIKEDELFQRFPNEVDPVDYKEAIINLRKYISNLCFDYKIEL